MRTIKLVVEYDGTALCGWQRQANGPSVQAHLEDALAVLLGAPTRVTGASRTDAGVHARGQVAVFSTDRDIPIIGIVRAINALLPPAIAIAHAAEVAADFHPRYAASGKHYRYLLLCRAERSPRWATRAWHRRRPIELAALAPAAAVLEGTHDFAGFRAEGCAATSTVRTLDSIRVTPLDEPGLIAIDVRGTAFLRHMVRILVGTMVDVAEGRFTLAELAEILASLDRARAGQTAPGHGLELVEVLYAGRGDRLPRRAGPDPAPGV